MEHGEQHRRRLVLDQPLEQLERAGALAHPDRVDECPDGARDRLGHHLLDVEHGDRLALCVAERQLLQLRHGNAALLRPFDVPFADESADPLRELPRGARPELDVTLASANLDPPGK